MTARVHTDPEGLQRATLLRQLAELDRLEPPPELDRAVLERARRSVQPARAPRAARSIRWVAAAAVTLALTAALTSRLPSGPAANGRRVAVSSPAQARALPVSAVERTIPVSAVERAVPVAHAHAPEVSRVPVEPVNPALLEVPALSVAVAAPDSHELSAIQPLRLRLTSRNVQQIPSNAGWPSLVATDARARELVVDPRARLESPPEEWLRRIRQLEAEGRTADAEREWTAFTKAYSGYPVRGLAPLAQPHAK